MVEFRNSWLSWCLEAGDKRINITANPDVEQQCTQDFSSTPPTFPSQQKIGNISVSKKKLFLCVETGDKKWRTEAEDRGGGEEIVE